MKTVSDRVLDATVLPRNIVSILPEAPARLPGVPHLGAHAGSQQLRWPWSPTRSNRPLPWQFGRFVHGYRCIPEGLEPQAVSYRTMLALVTSNDVGMVNGSSLAALAQMVTWPWVAYILKRPPHNSSSLHSTSYSPLSPHPRNINDTIGYYLKPLPLSWSDIVSLLRVLLPPTAALRHPTLDPNTWHRHVLPPVAQKHLGPFAYLFNDGSSTILYVRFIKQCSGT